MSQPVDAAPVADTRASIPSLKIAALGFFASTTLTCCVMVLLGSL